MGSVDSKRQAYVRYNNRLALFRQRANADFWNDRWHSIPDRQLRHVLRPTGRLGRHMFFLRRWLPREGVVLEAGCGSGLWVRRLGYRGYNCIGIDYAVRALVRSKQVYSDFPLIGGDILNLPFADNTVSGYLSLGVIEHFEEGPKLPLLEATRVLRPNGIAMISVPYVNWLRRNPVTISQEDAHGLGLEFYQYYFSEASIWHELRQAGLSPIYLFHGYGTHKGLSERIPHLRLLPGWSKFSALLDFVPGLRPIAAHMIFTLSTKM